MIDRAGVGAEHAERLVADFPPVAVGAVEEVAPPALAGAGDVGQLVGGACCDEQIAALSGRGRSARRSTKPLLDLDDLGRR